MADISKIRIGVVSAVYKGIDLGHTKEGVVFNYEPEFTDLTVDKYGSTPIDKVLTGESLSIEITLAEPDIRRLNFAIAPSSKQESTDERLDLGRDAGYSLRDNEAGVLTLHPTRLAADNLDEDITIYKAVSTEPVELPYKVDEQRVFSVTFMALVDETYSGTRRLGHIGPSNIS